MSIGRNISAVILAGGENKRFEGIIKSNIIIGGKTIINRILENIYGIFDEIIIVTNTPEKILVSHTCRFISDIFPKKGPLAGIHSAMKCSEYGSFFVFAGDMPFLDRSIIEMQIKEYEKLKPDILVPDVNGLIEPLHSIYSGSVANVLEEFLNSPERPAVRGFFDSVNVVYMQFSDSAKVKMAFKNINTPEEASDAEREII